MALTTVTQILTTIGAQRPYEVVMPVHVARIMYMYYIRMCGGVGGGMYVGRCKYI